MLPDWVSNPGPLTYESGALPTALHGLAVKRYGTFIGEATPANLILLSVTTGSTLKGKNLLV